MLGKLGSSLREAIKKFLGRPVADELAVRELIRDVQRALLLADVNVDLVLKITQRIEERALKNLVRQASLGEISRLKYSMNHLLNL